MAAASSATSSSGQITWPQCTQTFRSVATSRCILKVAYEGEVLQLWLEHSNQFQYYAVKSKDECEAIFAESGFDVALVQEMFDKAVEQREGFSLGMELQGEAAVLLQLRFRYMQKTFSFRLLNVGEVDHLRHVETTEVLRFEAPRQARDDQPPRHEQEVAELRREVEKLRAQQLAMKAEMAAERKALREEFALKQAEAARSASRAGPSGLASAGAGVPARPWVKPRLAFIQVVGSQRMGKTRLLEKLITDWDPQQLGKFREQRNNLMALHRIQIEDSCHCFLDCSGHPRCKPMVQEWYPRSVHVCAVYDVADAASLEFALEAAKEAAAEGARPILFGNLYGVESGKRACADVSKAKECAARNGGLALEGCALIDAVKMALG